MIFIFGRRDYKQPAAMAIINSLNHYPKGRHTAAQTEDGLLAEGSQLLVQSDPLPQTAHRVKTKQPTPC